jgi:hypothetical protein
MAQASVASMSLDAIVFIEISTLYTIHAKLWLISKEYILKGESIEGSVLLSKLVTRRNEIRLLVKQIEWTFSHLEWLQRR